jgi:hypothetical protein
MKNYTVFINPNNFRVNGFSPKIYESGEYIPQIPYLLTGENGITTGVAYIDPIVIVTGYDPDLKYKTYNPQTNMFV